ncbi:Peroxisomal membrane protein 4 [Golovinomyces cichoracearum]|uniref:Peroxisomal membrane protein 4 n=1 Tax=Golovinomyces cichoracearum TaxID=62708 RepID=A0A420HQP6_9PEZI|nr:Peroxisomal membrane protein 4 [Golovinomyces cichoracearum]
MTFLFRSGTIREKILIILQAVRTHAKKLATFAVIYKTAMLLLKRVGSDPGKEGTYDTFFAGLLGGYLVFGRRPANGRVSSISKQIVIFGMKPGLSLFYVLIQATVFARVCLSLAQVLVKPAVGIIRSQELSARISHDAWPLFAALSWGSVMWLFRWHPETIQTGLRSSMKYIYLDSDHWDSLRNLLIYNK